MYCSKCGSVIQNDVCASCGTRNLPPQQNYWHPDMYGNSSAFAATAPPNAEVAAAESKSVASLVMGILSMALSALLVGFILGPLAISNANYSRSVLDESNQKFWIALAGKITGIIGLCISGFFAFYWIIIWVVVAALV
jgi:hypothetical protein